MSLRSDSSTTTDGPPSEERAPGRQNERRRYERPRILSREALEGVAAVCTPVGKASIAACPSGPIAS